MPKKEQGTIRYLGKEYPVLERIRIGDRTYFLIRNMTRSGRHRYQAIAPAAPPDERMCAVLLLPRSHASTQHLRILRRLSRDGGNINLPRIHAFSDLGDDVAVATTWIKGIALDQYLREADEGVLTRRSPTNIMMQLRGLVLGLQQLHRHRGIIHGDIKPGNLVLTAPSQRIVMIDFGSAWMKTQTAYRHEGDGNTAAYAAPEQLVDAPGVYEAIDQFSASVVAYELLTGQLPYGGMGGRAGLPEYRNTYESQWQPPSRLSPHRKDVPHRIWRRIDGILERSLSLDPEDRYPTDQAWLADLNALRSEIDRRTEEVSDDHWMVRCGNLLTRVLRKTQV